jgi:predicted Zn-dependent protease with MMP-like domain/Tfp pilus assembly protein PilF
MKKHQTPPPAMDALSAHLDRGWDLLRKNDLDGAGHSARKALGLEHDCPEALTLLGSVAGARGELDEALDWYRKASAADPEYVSPLLYAAEILMGEGGDLDEALGMIEDALEASDEEDDYLDALILKGEALLLCGDRDDEAREALAELPPVEFPEAVYHLRAARCFLDLELPDEAEQHFAKAIKLDPTAGDAFHGLGCVHEQREDHGEMVKCWLRTRELDLEEPPPPWGVSHDEFERIAEEALAEIPERIRRLLENVPILASDYPSVEIVAEGNDPRMMGFFSGLPYPEKSNVGQAPHLDCVFLYQKNIERMSRTRDEVAKEIRITLLHETGHFFGLSEEELDQMGLG